MKKYLVLLFLAVSTTFAFAQSNLQEVVYLKNGSVIRGVVIEQIPNKSIKIETADNNVFVYKMDEVEKFTKEPYQGKNGRSLNGSGLHIGYKGVIELGHQIGVGDYGLDRIKLNIINGYQFTPDFSLGFGTGMRYYFDEAAIVIPVFADFRINFIEKKISPYFSLGVGYSFDSSREFEGLGFLFNPSVGISFKVLDKSTMNVSLGYEMQKMEVNLSYHGYCQGTKSSDALGINLGITF